MLYRIVFFAGQGASGSKPFDGDEAGAVEFAKHELASQKSQHGAATKAVIRDRNLKVVTEVAA